MFFLFREFIDRLIFLIKFLIVKLFRLEVLVFFNVLEIFELDIG